jgi:hypothetical protein
LQFADAALNPEFDADRPRESLSYGYAEGDRISFSVTTPPLTRDQADALENSYDTAAVAISAVMGAGAAKITGSNQVGTLVGVATSLYVANVGNNYHVGDRLHFFGTVEMTGSTDSGFRVIRSSFEHIKNQ